MAGVLSLRNFRIKTFDTSFMQECFEVGSLGELTWKERPASHFKTDRERKRWNGRYAGRRAEKPRGTYLCVTVNKRDFLAHRVVYCIHHCVCLLQYELDHRDGNRCNNRPTNLRVATKFENQWNATIRTDSSSGVKGVSFQKRTGCWLARVRSKNRRYHCYFKALDEAEAWVIDKRSELHGAYAKNG